MSAIESVDALVELLAQHPDTANWTGGLNTEDLTLAESELGTVFPPSYRHFLSRLGSCEAGSEEFLGVHRTPAMGEQLLGTVVETLEARADLALPDTLLVIQFDGMGGLISLDVSRLDERGEAPVVVWDPGSADRGGPERLDPDFGTYVLRQCQHALLRGWLRSTAGLGFVARLRSPDPRSEGTHRATSHPHSVRRRRRAAA